MKRRILIWAAVAAIALPLGEAAVARDHDGDQGRGGGGRGRAERWEGRRDTGPRYEAPPRDEAPRGEGRRADGRRNDDPPRRDDDRRPAVRGFREDGPPPSRGRWDDERRYEDAPPTVRAPQRGGYLPDRFRGGVVEDYQRYRLRTPPRGYAWVRVGSGFALVSTDDGRIFDMVQ